MKKLIALLVGENQDMRIALLMLIPPLFFVLFILLSFPIDYKTIITGILGFDIFAGLLSNFQEKTYEAWRKQQNRLDWFCCFPFDHLPTRCSYMPSIHPFDGFYAWIIDYQNNWVCDRN